MVLNDHGEPEDRYVDGSSSHIGELVQTDDDVRSSKCWTDSLEQEQEGQEEDNMACVCP